MARRGVRISVRSRNRIWLLYPRPVRTFYRINAQIVGGIVLVMLGVVFVALLAQWLMSR